MSKKITTKKLKLVAQAASKTVQPGKIKTNILSGMASAGPPLGPLLGQLGINIAAFCKDFNNRTNIYKEGVPLPCRITVKPDRSYDLVINHPCSSYFLMQAAGINRGSMSGKEICGKITIKHIYEIAKIKQEDYQNLLTPLQDMVGMLVGSAHAIGLEVVKDLDPEEYRIFLEERKQIVETQLQELQDKKEAKMLKK